MPIEAQPPRGGMRPMKKGEKKLEPQPPQPYTAAPMQYVMSYPMYPPPFMQPVPMYQDYHPTHYMPPAPGPDHGYPPEQHPHYPPEPVKTDNHIAVTEVLNTNTMLSSYLNISR